MLEKLSLRFRLFLFFALLAVLAIVAASLAIWAGLAAAPEEQLTRLTSYTGMAGVALAIAAMLVWLLFDQYIARALQSLARAMETALHGGSRAALNDADLRYLGPLRGVATQVLDEVEQDKAVQQQKHAAMEASLRTHERRLAALLRNLDQPLLLLNREHRITLFNDEAAEYFAAFGHVAVGRRLGEWFELQALKDAFAELERQCREGSSTPKIPCTAVPLQSSRATEALALGPIQNDDGSLSGYVLTLAGRTSETREAPRPARPFFHDFDLFDRHPDNALSARSLSCINLVVFDTETTGLQPSAGDTIVSIAGVRIVNGRIMSAEHFDELVNPGRPIPAASTRFHGIVDDDVRDADSLDMVLPRFHRYVADSVLVAHNAAFDMTFLKQSASSSVNFENTTVLDTVLLSAFVHDHSSKHTLDDLAERFGIDIRGRHTALGDAEVTAEVFLAMLPLLAQRGVNTLSDAVEICSRETAITRQQGRY